ncbi:MAG: hypothetical protein K1X29_08155 [Bdellovibrionales bacterium]|nr:hypothetical protein [Bdellovibrionales bacterium]
MFSIWHAKVGILFIFMFLLFGCKQEQDANGTASGSICRGEYTVKDSNGLVRQRFNEYNSSLGCLTDPVPLTQWEKSSNQRFDKKISCTPQADLPSMHLKASGNYYSYRNSRIFMELNSSTGEAKRLIIGEMPDGRLSFNRQVFCYYLRTDVETEPTNPFDYGKLLHLDLELSASSDLLSPQELYNYQVNGNDILLHKLDDNSEIDWTFCPTGTPIGFCDYLRNGNEFYFPPDPSAAVQSQLRSAAILIRSELNMTKISTQEFNSIWDSSINSGVEVGTSGYLSAGGKWKFLVNSIWDEPFFVGRAVRNYMRRDPLQPFMPDLAWASSMQFPYICYSSSKEITFADGSKGKIYGTTCYNNGAYSFISD